MGSYKALAVFASEGSVRAKARGTMIAAGGGSDAFLFDWVLIKFGGR